MDTHSFSADLPAYTFGLDAISVDAIDAIAAGNAVALSETALDAMQETYGHISRAIENGTAIYGLTTGVGDLYSVALSKTEIQQFQMSLLRSHASGVGEPLDRAGVRAIMACALKAMLQGHSGVSPGLARTIAAMLNRDVTPWAPIGGSVGYLIATAHIGLAVFGQGKAWFQGELLSGGEALRRAGIPVRPPEPREGHALISGTFEISGLGSLALSRARELVQLADLAGAMSLEAMRGNTRGYDARVQNARPHEGQIETARRMRSLLADSAILEAHRDYRLQDALSLRCIPQVHGAARDALAYCGRTFEIELNAVTDNPFFVVEEGTLLALPNGNGHGAPLALSLDTLAIAIASLSTISQARCDRLTTAHLSTLPAFLSAGGGSSAMIISPCVAAALSADNRALAAPASVNTMTTVAGQEDHVSMGVAAARKALAATSNLMDLLSVEFLCAAQALDFHQPLRPGAGTGAALDLIRTVVPFRDQDRDMYPDLAAVRALIEGGRLNAIIDRTLDAKGV